MGNTNGTEITEIKENLPLFGRTPFHLHEDRKTSENFSLIKEITVDGKILFIYCAVKECEVDVFVYTKNISKYWTYTNSGCGEGSSSSKDNDEEESAELEKFARDLYFSTMEECTDEAVKKVMKKCSMWFPSPKLQLMIDEARRKRKNTPVDFSE